MLRLDAKNVLLIAPSFFGYANEIKKEFESRGARVVFLEDRPLKSTWMVALSLPLPFLKRFIFSRLCNRFFLDESSNIKYDLVFVVNGESFTQKLLLNFRRKFAQAKFILYVWDSIDNKPDVLSFIEFYDAVYSFDKVGAKKHGLRFRPLFFSSGFESKAARKCLYDVSFIGTIHSDRYPVLSEIKNHFPTNIKAFIYLYIQAPWVYWVRKLTDFKFMKSKLSDFKFKAMSKEAVQELFMNSRIIIDIEHPNQTGLTMRSIEALGAQKKIITTNASIADYDFYNDSNILIIDRISPHVPESFLYSEYHPVSENIYDRYRLSSWLDEILEGVNLQS